MSPFMRHLQEDAEAFECRKSAHWHYICVIFDGPIEMPISPGGSGGKESACNEGDLGLIPELGRSLGEGNGNPLQYSCLENSMERGARQATVHGVTKGWTRLKRLKSQHIEMLIFLGI